MLNQLAFNSDIGLTKQEIYFKSYAKRTLVVIDLISLSGTPKQ